MSGLTKIARELATLLKMRELLSDPDNWCKEQRHDGKRMCLVGAYELATGRPESVIYPETADLLGIPKDAYIPIQRRIRAALFNDSARSHAQILDVIDRAISSRVC